jgi:hypothetical protein
VVGDYPGHCKVLEMMGAGAHFGCTKCMTRGEHIARRMVYHNYRHLLPEGHDFLTDPEFGKPIEPPVAPEMKTKELVDQLVGAVLRSGEPIAGIKGHASGNAHNNTPKQSTNICALIARSLTRARLLSILPAARFRYRQGHAL